MKLPVSETLRLLHINSVLIRHGLDEVFLATHFMRPLRFMLYLLPWNWFRGTREPRAVRVRRALEELGPIFVKFGQILSTRRDLLPDDLAEELARLQDRVPSFPSEVAISQIEAAYGRPLHEVFATFQAQPLASASIAQVHVATLKSGEDVVVKVLRPGIKPIIRRDVGLLHTLARLAERYSQDGRRLRPVEVVAEFEKTLLDELDLMREAASASQMRRNFEHSEVMYVPEVYWPLCRRNVMVMERIHGTPVGDLETLRAAGVNMQVLAERGVEIFFTQVFRHNFFHADMHPGNIFVDIDAPRWPSYKAVDFGIMGSLSSADKRYLAENFLAFFKRDYYRVAELHVISGWVPQGTRIDEFEAAIRTVCEPIFERPFKDISFGQLLLRLFQTARRFNMEVQPQLVLLQKTLLNIEGLGRQLYPELDLWKTAKPFLEHWMKEQLGLRGLVREFKTQAPRWGEMLPHVPGLVHDVLKKASEGELKLRWQAPELRQIQQEVKRASQRNVLTISGGSLIISATLLYAMAPAMTPIWAGIPVASWLLGGFGIYLVAAAWSD